MIEVLIDWFFISITAYAFGYLCLDILSRLLGLDIKNIKNTNIVRILLGLAAVNVYAEVWSLFGPVGSVADYILLASALLIVLFNRNGIGMELPIKPACKNLVYLILIILFAYGTSRGYMHFDTNLYHAQAIRWIEEYGLVPGLANLQSRFGYNSAEFALNALYSCKWYLGRSLHCTAGYFALISSFMLVDIKDIVIKNDNNRISFRPRISDFVRLGLIFYLATIYSEMISPASDYYAQLLIFDIVILWLDAVETIKSTNMADDTSVTLASIQGILCIILAYAITIKLSLGLLVLLALIPGIYWIKNKNYRSIITCIVSGLVIAVPYFIRNYIISGWILYPSTVIKLGSPDWQLPIGEAQYDAREISMWGRGITDATKWEDITAFNWIPAWFRDLSFIELIWVIGTIVAIIVIVALTVSHLVKKNNNQIIPVLIVLAIGTLFWFCSAPLVRYGYAYLIIMPLITIGYLASTETLPINVIKLGKLGLSTCIFAIIAICICGLKGKSLADDIIRTKDYPYYTNQQDYIDGDATSYNLDGVDIYVADDAGQIGYYKFPATPDNKTDIKLRGADLTSGFMKR